MYRSPAENQGKTKRLYMLAIALAIVMCLVVAPEVQNGNYMNPSMHDGDLFVTYKLARYSSKREAPEKDSLVVLEKKISLEVGADDNIITRVIAVPGDTVSIKDGVVLVNGKEYITRNGVSGATGKFKKTKLKGNQIFVLCDNRSADGYEIFDSRNPRLGLVDMRKIHSTVLLRIYPFKSFGLMNNN